MEDNRVQADYLEAIFHFALNTLPPASERVAEAAHAVAGADAQQAHRSPFLVGVATGCPANFT